LCDRQRLTGDDGQCDRGRRSQRAHDDDPPAGQAGTAG
jgi:hypothetical protein